MFKKLTIEDVQELNGGNRNCLFLRQTPQDKLLTEGIHVRYHVTRTKMFHVFHLEKIDYLDTLFTVTLPVNIDRLEVYSNEAGDYYTNMINVNRKIDLSDVMVIHYLEDLNLIQDDYSELLLHCCSHGYLNVIQYLDCIGVNMFYDNEKPLITACHKGQKEVVDYLISRGAEIRVNNYEPLKIALTQHHTELASLLLKNNFDQNMLDNALLNAIRSNDIADASNIITLGGKISNDHLIIAVTNNKEDMVSFLIRKGADVSIFHSLNNRISPGIRKMIKLDPTFDKIGLYAAGVGTVLCLSLCYLWKN